MARRVVFLLRVLEQIHGLLELGKPSVGIVEGEIKEQAQEATPSSSSRGVLLPSESPTRTKKEPG